MVTREFGHLDAFGFHREKVWLHFQGNYVQYRSARHDLFVSYEPESTGSMEVTIVPLSLPDVTISVDMFAREHGLPVPAHSRPPSRNEVERYVRAMAQIVMKLGDELFRPR